MYPGLAHNPHFSKGNSVARSSSHQWLTKNRIQLIPTQAPTEPPKKTVESTKRTEASKPGPSFKAGSEHKKQYISSKETSQLQAIAEDFRTADFNLAKIFAEAVVFIGLVLLNWSLKLAKPQRVLALTKLALAIAFFTLHPIYAIISASAIGLTYTYLKLSRRANS